MYNVWYTSSARQYYSHKRANQPRRDAVEVFKRMGVVHGQVLQAKATEQTAQNEYSVSRPGFIPALHAVLDTFRRFSSDDRRITSSSVISDPGECSRCNSPSL